MVTSCRCRRLGFGLLVASALVGCREAESISTYDTEATGPRARPIDVDRVRGDLDHMLVAIVPQGDAAWFLKVVAHGDKSAEALRKPFEEFIGSVELGGKGETPKWKLPEGWVEKAGGEMRVATIEIPYEGKTLELAVSTLPLSGKWETYLANNVDRWLDQLQQGKLTQETINKLAKSIPIEGGEATIIELVGLMQATPGMMPAGHPPVAAAGGAKPQAGKEEAKTQAAAAPRAPFAGAMAGPVQVAGEFAKPAEFAYEPPAGWQPGQTNSMRKAAFVVSEDGMNAQVTVMPFSANEAMLDPVVQAQRWSKEAGLSMSDDELKAAAKEVTISGATGHRFTFLSNDAGKTSVLAAMVPQGDQVWFFKMFGDRPLVEKQEEAFGKLLESVKFAE